MLVTKQPVLRRFWYPVIPETLLQDGRPKPFRLLGEDIVVWLDKAGEPHALIDRCCHRSAKLSEGWVNEQTGTIICGYHGWEYDGSGACTRIPQWKDQAREIKFKVEGYQAKLRYGYVWVCLSDAPLQPIPEVECADDPANRLIQQFYESWNCAGLRLMENSFDNAHISFVHRQSFGNITEPEPADILIEENDQGLVMRSEVPVINNALQMKNLGLEGQDRTVRHLTSTWYMPFARQLHIRYPNGLLHAIVTVATPIDDGSSQVVQFCVRSDTEEQAPAADIIAFDRQVTAEDRGVLESTEADVPLRLDSGREFHMPSDRPGIIMRKRLLALLEAHGEQEVSRQYGAKLMEAAE